MRKVLALVLPLLLHAIPAQAADPTPLQLKRARELFHEAEGHEDRREWPEALRKLRLVAEVKLTPGVRSHIALCEENVGDLAAAHDDYVAALEEAKATHAEEVVVFVTPRLASLRRRVGWL